MLKEAAGGQAHRTHGPRSGTGSPGYATAKQHDLGRALGQNRNKGYVYTKP